MKKNSQGWQQQPRYRCGAGAIRQSQRPGDSGGSSQETALQLLPQGLKTGVYPFFFYF